MRSQTCGDSGGTTRVPSARGRVIACITSYACSRRRASRSGLSRGRADGWRTFARKSTFEPGHWRVTAETDDGRAVGTMSFDIEEDTSTDERILMMDEG